MIFIEYAKWFEWSACLLGSIGALLLAINNQRYSGLGFVLFLMSNTLWGITGFVLGATGLVFQQLIFSLTSLYGIYNWLVVPRLNKRTDTTI